MKYKVGDKVKLTGEKSEKIYTILKTDFSGHYGHIYLLGNGGWYFKEQLEPVEQYKTDAEVMRDIINGWNSKPHDPVNRPTHYENDGRDLFDEWHERYYNDSKTYTGKEVFSEIMKAVAERYIRRYPNKNAEDIDKGIYTLSRLKEYEENTK